MGAFMDYHFNVIFDGKDFIAECVELKGCITQARTVKELNKNLKEALNLYLSTVKKWPKPKKKQVNWVSVPVSKKLLSKREK
jgi:antitoxin HicB